MNTWRCCSTLSCTSPHDRGEWPALPHGPFIPCRLGSPPNRRGRCGFDNNLLTPLGIDPRLSAPNPSLFLLSCLTSVLKAVEEKSSGKHFLASKAVHCSVAAAIMKHCLQMASSDRLYSIIFRLYSLSSFLLSGAGKGRGEII